MIYTPTSIGELIDKITILQIKTQFIRNEEKLANVKKELEILTSIPEYISTKNALLFETEELLRINAVLWKLEDDIREYERKQEFKNGFITTARMIYKTNDDRSRVKKEINLKLGSELVEEKSYEDVL